MSELRIDVTANIAKYKAGMDKAAHEAKKLQQKLGRTFGKIKRAMTGVGALAGVAVGGSFVAMGKKALDSADKIGKMSTRLGISTEALSQYEHVAALTGVTFETLTMGFQRQTRRISEAAAGFGEAKGALQELNLSAEDLNKLSPDKQFEVLADAIQKVQSPADKVRLAMKLWDSEGVSLLQTIEGGSEKIREMTGEADALGKTLSQDQVDAAAAANDALTQLSSSIGGAVRTSIADYSGSIKSAADFTRKYLPKAIEFLLDMLRSLKIAFNLVTLGVQKNLANLFSAASKLPFGVGKKFEGLAATYEAAAQRTKKSIDDTIDATGKWREESEETAKTIEKKLVPAIELIKPPTKRSKEEIARITKVIREMEKAGKDFADNIPERIGANMADLDKVLLKVRLETVANKQAQEALAAAVTAGKLTTEEAIKVAAEMGITLEETAEKSETATELMLQGWKKFQDGVQDAFYNAFRSGQNFFDSLKNLAFDILAQIAAKIATTFALDSLSGLFKGTKIGDLLNVGDLVKGSGGKGGLGDIVSSAASSIGRALGIGTGTAAASGIVGGSTIAGIAVDSTAALYAGSGAASGAAGAGVLASIGSGIKAAGSAMAAGASSIMSGISAAVAAIPGWGWAIAGVAALAKIFGGGGRSPMELGRDQLNAVNQALAEGRTEAVQLSDALSFRGGFNEFGTFWDVAGKTRAELQAIGDAYVRITGADAALAINETTLRIEDFGRKFSESNDYVVASLQQAIAEVEAGLTSVQVTGVNAANNIGGAFNNMLGGISVEPIAAQINAAANDSENELVQVLQPIADSAVVSQGYNQPLFAI